VVFDLAFDLPEEAPASGVVDAVRQGAGPALESVELFDLFTGPPLEEGRKSLALRLTLRAPDRTLTDEDLAPVRDGVVARVAERMQGRLRGG
jgi:phenylalanyl-tRNA synthetase beta chain